MELIDQLQEILCTVESVEKDVKELKMGTYISYRNKNGCWSDDYIAKVEDKNIITRHGEKVQINGIDENFGNPLTLKHLMMYCNEKGIFIEFDSNGDYGTMIDGHEVYLGKYDITKELYEQEDKEIKKIINFLKG